MGLSGAAPLPGTEVERIRSSVALYFPVYETRITPVSLVLLVQADPATLEEKFDKLRQEFWTRYYIPQIRREGGEFLIEVIRRPHRPPWSSLTNAILLAITIGTTMLAGAFLWVAYVGGKTLLPVDVVYGAAYFGLPLLAILGVHELAHFVMARHHHVEASLPYFIPVPPPFLLFGTFGAFISLREPIPTKKALLDIGASGPLAGFALAVPITVLGMFLSANAPILSVANCGPSFFGVGYGNFIVGTSLFWYALTLFVPVAFVNLHPLALAGWVGLLVTAINLLPAGQLDGGHVFRALFGERTRWVSYAAVGLLLVLGIFYPGWLLFAILIVLLGMRHPPPLNDITPLDRKRIVVGAVAVMVLLTGFVLIPIGSPNGNFAVNGGASVSQSAFPGMHDTTSVLVNNRDVVAHGYVIEGAIVSVTGPVNGTTQTLSGALLASFLANSTWQVTLPNGNVTAFGGSGTFAVPAAEYSQVNDSSSASFTVVYTNIQQASVTATLTVEELCSGPASPNRAVTVVMT
ncbi:MAG: site-2 protease family protein [Thermoplasmata archaeon]|nr:site-2 protease family protein [Thermoplasmata archaeon]